MKSDKAPKVTSIDSFSIKAEIKKCPINVQQYISALERALERQKDVTNKAIKKIKELSEKEAEDCICWIDGCNNEKIQGHVACERHHNEVINKNPTPKTNNQ